MTKIRDEFEKILREYSDYGANGSFDKAINAIEEIVGKVKHDEYINGVEQEHKSMIAKGYITRQEAYERVKMAILNVPDIQDFNIKTLRKAFDITEEG